MKEIRTGTTLVRNKGCQGGLICDRPRFCFKNFCWSLNVSNTFNHAFRDETSGQLWAEQDTYHLRLHVLTTRDSFSQELCNTISFEHCQ
jgi:hypothetical protein